MNKVTYWVRDGYNIKIVDQERFEGANPTTVIQAYKTSPDVDDSNIVQSYQNVQESMNITTLNKDELYATNTDMYAGAVNSPTTSVTRGDPDDPNVQGNEFVINNGTFKVNENNFSSYFKAADFDATTGLYSYRGQTVSMDNLYVVDGEVGVFLTQSNGDQIYTGDVYGVHNEILMTAKDEKGKYVSYWGAEIVDPSATIGDMTIDTLEGKFDVVNNDIKALHKDDISEIQVNHTKNGTAEDGKGGTIGLATNGGAMIPGGITVTSEAKIGEDTKIRFANEANSDGFTVDAGSRVVGKTGENPATEGETLTSIDINGKNYLLGGGKTYSDGDGIAIDNNEISVDLAENSGLHFVTENGEKKLVNNLKVETVSGDNQGGWKITETTAEKAQSKEFTNTTLDADYSNTTNNDADSDVNNSYKGSSETDDEGVVYGRDYVVKDTAGNTINLNNVASATTLQNVAGDVIENTESISNLTTTVEAGWTAKVGDDEINVKPNAEGEKDKDVLNFEAGNNIALTADAANNKITIGAEGVVSYDKVDGEYTSFVTLGGDNNYTPASDNGETPASGGVKLTNVAYASGNDKSEAVNVDYLEKYVDKNGGGSWNLTTGEDTENPAVVGKGDTVDLAGATKGEGSAAHQNIHVTQETQYDDEGNVTGTNVKFDLDDKLVLGENNQITIDGSENNATINLGNKVTLNGADGTATIGGVKVNNTYDSNGNITSSTIDGLTNTDWNESNYDGSAKAATEGQLYDALSNITDYQLVENPANGSDGKYTVDNNGNLTLTVKDLNNKNAATKTITISGVAVIHDQYKDGEYTNLRDTKAQIWDETAGASDKKSSSIALGKDAFVSVQNGNKANAVLFDSDTYTGGIAIGQDSKALNGTVNIGVKDYTGKMGDVIVGDPNNRDLDNGEYNTYTAMGVGETSVGSNSYISGSLSTNIGSYNVITTKYMNGGNPLDSAQNFGSITVGTLNSIESNSSSSNILDTLGGKISGVANSVIGMANKTQNSNGSLVFGTGNEITNSIDSIPSPVELSDIISGKKNDKDVTEVANSFRDSVSDRDNKNGGAVLAIGGGNKADYALNSQLIGVQNQITGEKGDESEYNMVNGYQNTVENGSNDTVIGVKNTVTGDSNIVLGDKHTVSGTNNIILGSSGKETTHDVSDTVTIGSGAQALTDNSVAVGSNAQVLETAENSVAIGNGSVADDIGGISITEGTEAPNYAGLDPVGTVSVGSKGNERTITNVAAGRISDTSTDAVMVASYMM